MKKKVKLILALVVAIALILALPACTAVQVSSNLVINADGSGSRKIVGHIAKQDNNNDGYGSAYYYFKKHGAELETYIKGVYNEKVSGSKDWLTVSVDDSGSDWELVTMSFDFTSFEDYTTKLKALCYGGTEANPYVAPVFEKGDNGEYSYTESTGLIKAIYKSLQTTIMADPNVYDPKSTKDGVALNNGSADGQIEEYGVEIIKPENGVAMTISFIEGDPVEVEAVDGFFKISKSTAGEEQSEVSKVLHYTFDDVLVNTGTEADNDLTYGIGSSEGGPVFEAGINGKAIKLDGSTYLASPNKTYNFKEMTISFYYRMDAYTETDTGANMVVVPAGLGALGSGVIDIEFIKEGDAEGIQILSKMNSADWQTQDKLYSERFFLDSRLSEWHNYTLVYSNEYEDDGSIKDSYVHMYIDGKLAVKSRLSVAAGLTYSLGKFDEGTLGTPNGGFNLGGYFENDTVKRACTGLLDEFTVYNGALSEKQINELIYTTKVDKEYDPDASDDTNTSTPKPTEEKKSDDENNDNNNILVIAGVVVAVIAVAAVAVIVLKKKK